MYKFVKIIKIYIYIEQLNKLLSARRNWINMEININ